MRVLSLISETQILGFTVVKLQVCNPNPRSLKAKQKRLVYPLSVAYVPTSFSKRKKRKKFRRSCPTLDLFPYAPQGCSEDQIEVEARVRMPGIRWLILLLGS